MRRGPGLRLLAFSLAVSAASCRCTNDGAPGDAGTSSAPAVSASSSSAVVAADQLAVLRAKLANGLETEIATGDCGQVAVAVQLSVGVDHDPTGRSGLVRLAGRLLAAVPGAGVERAVEVGDDSTLVAVATPGWDAELERVAAWMKQPPFSEADFAREKARLLEDLGKLAGVDARATAITLAEEAAAPARGEGKRPGIAAEVEAITFAELTAFWKERYKPVNARLVVVGAPDAAAVTSKLTAAFDAIPAGSAPTLRFTSPTTVRGTLVMGEAPAAVAIAVVAPPVTDPLFAPFLVLAARLANAAPADGAWTVTFDPIHRPGMLLVTGPVIPGEQGEPAAARIRSQLQPVLDAPPADTDVAKTRARYSLLLDPDLLGRDTCRADPRAYAVARARRPRLGYDAAALGSALDEVAAENLADARKLFDPKKTTAVIAGGAIR